MADMVEGCRPPPNSCSTSLLREDFKEKKKTCENEKYLGAHQPLKTQLPQMISIKNK